MSLRMLGRRLSCPAQRRICDRRLHSDARISYWACLASNFGSVSNWEVDHDQLTLEV
ncbi:hypothetical protein M407DRAFT_247194 [Tulasnella calospora MUT 4182]|uniref:Uncharacterized protein n=1 Tax=Tulasnella calospora MUT 4182 TaxID=1051891 RepID=A0A0C3Q0P6_9AGAM|nr:hypothetical protein M407DRAFT_247194 [Tulasnella calospora MUT 4182]